MRDDEDFDEDEEWEGGYELPAAEISFEKGECAPWESKLGGCPYLRAKADYPIGENGKPMLFLAQINLRDIRHIPELPDHGLLQFFVEQSEMFGEQADPLVRWIEDVDEEGALTEHPFADAAYLEALPYERPGRILLEEVTDPEDVADENCRVGGYPFYPQDGDMEPDEEFLLLQLADEGVCGIGFGDCGVCHFVIDREDLAARDFSQVGYEWQCC